jgi:hypothetical protein
MVKVVQPPRQRGSCKPRVERWTLRLSYVVEYGPRLDRVELVFLGLE